MCLYPVFNVLFLTIAPHQNLRSLWGQARLGASLPPAGSEAKLAKVNIGLVYQNAWWVVVAWLFGDTERSVVKS